MAGVRAAESDIEDIYDEREIWEVKRDRNKAEQELLDESANESAAIPYYFTTQCRLESATFSPQTWGSGFEGGKLLYLLISIL